MTLASIEASREVAWVPIGEAFQALYHVLAREHGYNVAYRVAKEMLDGMLYNGHLEARAGTLEWSIVRDDGSIEMLAEGCNLPVPKDFWFHFFEADSRYQPDLILVQPEPNGPWTARSGSDFSFYENCGFREGVVSMSGKANGVAVRREQIPGYPKPKGRRPGSSQLIDADSGIVNEAIAAILQGRKRAEVIAEFAPFLTGPSSLDSKKRRLRTRLKERAGNGE